MKGWKKIRIADIGEVITGNTPPRKQPELYGEHTIFVKPTDINIGERYCLQPEECYSGIGFKKYKRSLIPQGATCVVTIGSIGQKMILAHQDLFINQAMNAVVPSENFDRLFVFYLLKLNLFQLKTFDSGTASGRENVSKSSFSAIEVTVPEAKQVQTKIGLILSAYDDLIENNLKRIKLLEEMAKITYEEWFVRMKFPGHEIAVYDKETGLPEGWEKSTLRDLTSYVNRGVAPKYVDENGVHVINQKCIREHKVNYSDSRLTSLKQKIAGDKIVLPLDILVNSTGTGTLGRVAQLFAPNGKTTVDTHVTIVRANENTCPFWLGRSLEALEPFIESLGKGATNQQELGRDDLADIVKLNSPPGELLKKFKEIAKPTYEVISNLLNQNERLKEARDILLPRLMTGMIDIEQVELPEAMLNRLEEQEDKMATA